jgi:hypothetical protein
VIPLKKNSAGITNLAGRGTNLAPSGQGNNRILGHTKRSGGNTSQGCHNRSQASNFRKSEEFCNIIRLIDVNRNKSMVGHRGRMTTINHTSVLQALSHRVRHFCDSRILGNEQEALQHSWAADKTGVINTACLVKLSDEEIQQKEAGEIIAAEVNNEVLRVHGHIPPKKGE